MVNEPSVFELSRFHCNLKANGYIFKGGNSVINGFCLPSKKGFIRKQFFPFKVVPFSERSWSGG